MLFASFGPVSVIDVMVPKGATHLRLDPLGSACELIGVTLNGHIGSRVVVLCGTIQVAEVISGISTHINERAHAFGANAQLDLTLSDVGVTRVHLHVRPTGLATQSVALHVLATREDLAPSEDTLAPAQSTPRP